MDYAIDPATLEIMKGIKRVFDPNGILNPGKMFVLPGNMKIRLSILIIAVSAISAAAQTSVIWKFDNLKKIGGHRVEVLGGPKVIKTDKGKAIYFDGVDDGIFIDNNPLTGAGEFTIEAIFRPDAGGLAEQRWLHIEDTENVESRALLETRLSGGEWFVDTFIKSGDNRMPLLAEDLRHPLGQWFHVALVFDGKEMRHYVNGKFEMSGPLTVKPFGKGKTSVGVRQNKLYWFKGAVRKARFTHRALSPEKFTK